MKKISITLFVLILAAFTVKWAISDSTPTERERRSQILGYVDNNVYWQDLAEQGLAILNPDVVPPQAVYTGSEISAITVTTDDSPDVPVTEVDGSTQSENSVFIDPNNPDIMLNSNNSTSVSGPPSYGADNLYTFDFGETFSGSTSGAGGNNDGDPAACIGTDGRWYVGYIGNGGQAVAYSDNQGSTWTRVQVASNPGQLADKNHMWIDAKAGSPYENNLYNSWTDFGGSYDDEIVVSHSADNGETWSNKQRISQEVNAGGHNQGVNLSTGPNGEVYAAWSIYDGWPQDERALGFAKSLDGGETWEPSYRIITNIRGIRQSGVPQNMRVASFPAMAVDVSSGSNSGTIYITWTNVGVPGVNSGSDRDIYLIKSTDEGVSWSEPIRVNQDPIGQGKTHYMPWIACDPANGTLSVIWYDNRNTNNNQAEAWVGISNNAGETWEDFKVSDVSFTPTPIPGMASGYFGDYLGITALDGKVYPCWTDNRSGHAMTYVSVFETITVTSPHGLQAMVDQESGACDLTWNFNQGSGFQNFRIYRNDEFIASTEELTYTDQLPEFGYYEYDVTAYYGGSTESSPTTKKAQWGSSTMEVIPGEFNANLFINDSVVQVMKMKNTGVLELDFSLSPFLLPLNRINYESAKGGGDEYISKVILKEIDHSSGSENYSDYTHEYARLEAGNAYPIQVSNGNAYRGDQCAVWIDWDGNGKFDETAIVLSPDETNRVFSGMINVPEGAVQVLTTMRVRITATGDLAPYGDSHYGEVEDYSVLIASWLTLTPDEGLIAPGDSLLLDLEFNATGLEIGTYNNLIRLITNDIEHPLIAIPVALNVIDFSVVATADPSNICLGSGTQLSAIPEGGSGTYSYNWTSIPEGFSSTEQTPFVSPIENTKYIVVVDDGTMAMTDSTEVMVYELPVVNLGEDLILCGEDQHFLDAGNEGASYLWSTGEITQTIVAAGEGENQYWVEVTNENNCAGRDTINITFATIPEVNLGMDTELCYGQTYPLDAGNPGANYLWSTGEITQTIVVVGEGDNQYWVEVTNENNCVGNDTINITMLPTPEVDLGVDTVLCHDQTYPLDAGNPGANYLWSTGETTQTILVDAADFEVGIETFSVTVTNEYTCESSAEMSIEIRDCIGIDELSQGIDISFFPNPSRGIFNLELGSSLRQEVNIKIISVTGTVVYEKNNVEVNGSFSGQIDLKSFSSGVYAVFVSGKDFIVSKKIVVRK